MSCGGWDQGGESSLSCLSSRSAVEPCVQTGEVDGRRGEDVLEVGFHLSKIAAAAQPKAPNALRQSAFDPGATGIAFLPDLAFLLDTTRLQSFMLRLEADNQAAGAAALTGERRRAQGPVRAGGACRRSKSDADQGSAPPVAGFRPVPAGLTGRASGDPVGPDDREGAEIEPLFTVSPPAVIQRDRAEQIDGVINLAR